ncbi:MAG: glycerophosphoryl diester phosphodiesterase [Alphaproteobacteria bacterium]|jgi:glycerophosphoryl diester phosphodiesterase
MAKTPPDNSEPLIIGHRGAAGLAPENTLRAFQAAIDVGADGVELDVHLTLDSIPLVLHDSTLDRGTNGNGPVSNYTFDEINEIGFAGIDDPIPNLDEVLKLLEPTSLLVNIEIKNNHLNRPYEGIEAIVEKSLTEAKMLDRAVISSFNWAQVSSFLKIARPRLSLGLLGGGGVKSTEEILASLNKAMGIGFDGICFPVEYLPQKQLPENIRTKIWVYAANDKISLRRALIENPAGIITDRPNWGVEMRAEMRRG